MQAQAQAQALALAVAQMLAAQGPSQAHRRAYQGPGPPNPLEVNHP